MSTAPLTGVPPIDSLNKAGKNLCGQGRSYGLAFLNSERIPSPTRSIDTELNVLKQLAVLESGDGDLAGSQRRLIEERLAEPETRKAEATAARRAELAVDLRETVSAGASFVVLNYTMFGLWFIMPSRAFVLALGLLLLVYLRKPPEGAIAAIGASVVPILTLCFSLFTTVLASKGLLAVPLVAWLVTRIPNSWFSLGYKRPIARRLQPRQ